ncbi:Nucleotidyltransferase [Salinimicrobium catena]|uniref:Nucleotidyltransferase n=1 Tax=Salinimicrobium catena TaxID=390640 RepID=A0A1H5P8D5_9FLAO|nr:DUF427 domain-containing protein [Salinimicrobium catena]SDL71200.1 Nucleotidyltransferase [Salinimicrobium catena]SEF09287.1 Nucleotidyltransferase [Salinimicrobium catena]
MKAIWNNTILAESNNTKYLEDNHYFPPDSLNSEFFQLSDTHSTAPGKGKASYFHIQVGDHKNADAAWFYPHPEEVAKEIKNYVAFGKDVEIRN